MQGRSDSTLNRHGESIATAGICRTVARLQGTEDSLVLKLDLRAVASSFGHECANGLPPARSD